MTLRKRWHEEEPDIKGRGLFLSTFLCGGALGLLLGIGVALYLFNIYLGR